MVVQPERRLGFRADLKDEIVVFWGHGIAVVGNSKQIAYR